MSVTGGCKVPQISRCQDQRIELGVESHKSFLGGGGRTVVPVHEMVAWEHCTTLSADTVILLTEPPKRKLQSQHPQKGSR